MSVVLAALMASVVLYCALRMAIPRWRDEQHEFAVDLTHIVMGTVMVAMFLTTVPAWAEGPAVAIFSGAFVWFTVTSLRGRPRVLFLRIGATCAAMLFMLSPLSATAQTAHRMSGSQAMTVAGHPTATTLLAMAIVLAMIAVAVDATLEFLGRPTTTSQRLSTLCEVSMSGAMGYMLAVML